MTIPRHPADTATRAEGPTVNASANATVTVTVTVTANADADLRATKTPRTSLTPPRLRR